MNKIGVLSLDAFSDAFVEKFGDDIKSDEGDRELDRFIRRKMEADPTKPYLEIYLKCKEQIAKKSAAKAHPECFRDGIQIQPLPDFPAGATRFDAEKYNRNLRSS